MSTYDLIGRISALEAERDSAKRSWGELATRFEDQRAQLAAVTKERNEARAELGTLGVYLLTGETGTEVHMPEGGPAAENVRLLKELDETDAENARLRAAIAPTAENLEANYNAYCESERSQIEANRMASVSACLDAVVTAIAARAGVKL